MKCAGVKAFVLLPVVRWLKYKATLDYYNNRIKEKITVTATHNEKKILSKFNSL